MLEERIEETPGEYMNIIIIGPQASGKGTQANRIAEHYGLFHFSTGDALRAEVKSGSELGQQIKAVIDAGNLVGDELIYGIVKNAYEHHQDGLILDGFPRTTKQAELMQGTIPIDAVLEIKVADETAIERISSRYVCSQCGHGYNTVSLPPKAAGICDYDGSPLVQRDDDKAEAVKKRLATYHEQTSPVIAFYESEGVPVYHIKGEQSIEDVFSEIKNAIDNIKRAA